MPIGRQIRQVMIGNDLLDGWTVTGTETTDDSGATFPATGPMVYRLGSDSPWDVVSQLCEQFIDVVVDAEGRTLRPFVKGRQGWRRRWSSSPGTRRLVWRIRVR